MAFDYILCGKMGHVVWAFGFPMELLTLYKNMKANGPLTL